jgi:hypothetical protein
MVHAEAYSWVARYATDDPVSVLDIGGRDVNGSPCALFPNADPYVVLDIADGPNVDIIADAAVWTPNREYSVILSTEVCEHTPVWPQICRTAHKACAPGGLFIVTMAGPGRAPHSAIDGCQLRPGEHYGNIDPAELRRVLEDCGWRDIVVDYQPEPADVHAVTVK